MKLLKLYFAIFAMVVAMASCSEAWLDKSVPNGSVVTQEQYDELDGTMAAHTNGLYTLMDMSNGSSHDYFGQKSIDIACDLLSSDMAITRQGYGWFETDATLTTWQQSASRNSYTWAYYYRIIKNCNVLLTRINDEGTLESDEDVQGYYAQALTMRGFAYYNLMILYGQSLTQLGGDPSSLATTDLVPYYNERSRVDSAVSLSSMADIAGMIESDLTTAMDYFEKSGFDRQNDKQRFDYYVAEAYLAKLLLEIGRYDEAFDAAADVCDNSGFTIIPLSEVTDNGFNDIEDNSWIWGRNVDANNRGALRSFWGHIDIHTYSYAFSGAYKAIDKELYNKIVNEHPNDVRKGWFSEERNLCPIYKFFPVGKKDAYTAAEIDRDWLSDDVLMRIEEMYLVAAESAARNNDVTNARAYLKKLVEQRYSTDGGQTADAAELAKIDAMDISSMLDGDNARLYYEWRIELWGEGRSLNVFKRFNPVTKNRGDNHFSYSQGTRTAEAVVFQIPSAELYYNLNLRDYYNL